MSTSIYHFFKSLVKDKDSLKRTAKLSDFRFDERLLSCNSASQFPDLAIKICKGNKRFTGGELVELKDTKNTEGLSYKISSFNSTIPTGRKLISKVVKGENAKVLKQMEDAGDDIFSVKEREVFYLVRGRNKIGNCKIALIHGSFFETIKSKDLITKSFNQVLEERLVQGEITIEKKIRKVLETLFSEQESFSKVRHVENASVSLRFRIMTEVKPEGNILNSNQYPRILDNTLNFVLPSHDKSEDKLNFDKMQIVFGENVADLFTVFHVKHHFNGNFLVFQQSL